MDKVLLFTSVANGEIVNGQFNVLLIQIGDKVNIQLTIPRLCEGNLELCDMSGKPLSIIAKGEIEKQSQYDISISDLPIGVFALKFVTGNNVYWQYMFCDNIIEENTIETDLYLIK